MSYLMFFKKMTYKLKQPWIYKEKKRLTQIQKLRIELWAHILLLSADMQTVWMQPNRSSMSWQDQDYLRPKKLDMQTRLKKQNK